MACGGVDHDRGVAVGEGCVAVPSGHHQVGAQLRTTVPSPSLGQLGPCVVPLARGDVVADHLGVVHAATDGDEGVVVHGEGARAVKRMGQMGALGPLGASWHEHLACPL